MLEEIKLKYKKNASFYDYLEKKKKRTTLSKGEGKLGTKRRKNEEKAKHRGKERNNIKKRDNGDTKSRGGEWG